MDYISRSLRGGGAISRFDATSLAPRKSAGSQVNDETRISLISGASVSWKDNFAPADSLLCNDATAAALSCTKGGGVRALLLLSIWWWVDAREESTSRPQ